MERSDPMSTHELSFSSQATATVPTFRELACRHADGITVRLLWDPSTDSLEVIVDDPREELFLTVPVGTAPPLDVFNHPFTYAPCQVLR
jgi:hypothetical protein